MDEELKIQIPLEVDDSGSSHTKFKTSLDRFTKKEKIKIGFDFSDAGKEVKKITAKIKNDMSNKKLNSIKLSFLPTGKETIKLEKLKQQIHSLGTSGKDLALIFENVKQKFENISKSNDKDLSKSVKEYQKAFNELNKVTQVRKPSVKMSFVDAKDLNDMRTFINSLERFESINNRLHKNQKLSNTYSDILNRANKDLLSGNFDSTEIKMYRAELRGLEHDVRSAGLSGQTVLSRLTSQMQKLGIYLTGAGIILGIWRQLKQITSSVIELDKAVTDLSVATGYNRKQTKELVNTYSELGKELGSTTVQITKAADAWLRQGHSIEDTNKLIKDSMMLSKLGQIDSNEATTALTATMKAYGISVAETTSIVDKFTAVDMKAAFSAGGIAKAMQETATSAKLAGIDINRLSGYIARVAEVSQDAPESVGTFYRTLFARMGNIKSGQLIDPETSESLSDVETVLQGYGIKIRDTQDNFKNFGVVLDEVAQKWNNWGTVAQNAIAVAFSGTRQQDKFKILMSGYKEAMEYAEVAAESSGTALNKFNESYLNSVEASHDEFIAQYEQFSNTILNSELIKGTYDTGKGIMGVFTFLIDKLGAIPTLATVATGALAGFSDKGELKIKEFQTYYALSQQLVTTVEINMDMVC